MNFKNLDEIRKAGFSGFVSIAELRRNINLIPETKGIYFVLFNQVELPAFLEKGSGGFFKERDPNLSPIELKKRWIKDTSVIYIGQAGGNNSGATLRSRIRQYLHFGEGKKIGHWGGRLIWQIRNSEGLLICWLPDNNNPRELEKAILADFAGKYGRLPFANLRN